MWKKRVIVLICLIIILSGTLYIGYDRANRQRIANEQEHAARLYHESGETAPTAEPESTPSVEIEILENTLEPTAAATMAPQATPEPSASIEPATAEPTATIEPTATPKPTPQPYIFRLPTNPPVLTSFDGLLKENADTVGHLRVGKLEWPVVCRANDNDYYLNHNFTGEEAKEGAIFLDGSNIVFPEDSCLIIYGHNMKNDTMFGTMSDYRNKKEFRRLGTVSFSTLYAEHEYVPFAIFDASVNQGESSYFALRSGLTGSEAAREAYIKNMRKRSLFTVDFDVEPTDDLLLLVTCGYQYENDRLVLALRKVREGEDAQALIDAVASAS